MQDQSLALGKKLAGAYLAITKCLYRKLNLERDCILDLSNVTVFELRSLYE